MFICMFICMLEIKITEQIREQEKQKKFETQSPPTACCAVPYILLQAFSTSYLSRSNGIFSVSGFSHLS